MPLYKCDYFGVVVGAEGRKRVVMVDVERRKRVVLDSGAARKLIMVVDVERRKRVDAFVSREEGGARPSQRPSGKLIILPNYSGLDLTLVEKMTGEPGVWLLMSHHSLIRIREVGIRLPT
jgi:hypothetical protein